MLRNSITAQHTCRIKHFNELEYCNLAYDSLGFLKYHVGFSYNNFLTCEKEKCHKGQFLCRQMKFCISLALVCDGINHCFYNEDERGCRNFTYQNLYKCRKQGKGVLVDNVCNGIVDCFLGDDELYCINVTTQTNFCKFIHPTSLYCQSNISEKFIWLNGFDKNIKMLKISQNGIYFNITKNQNQILHITIIENNGNFSKAFRFFPNLVSVVLKSDNIDLKINFLKNLPLLQFLDVSFNLIKDLKWVSGLESERLIYLDLSGNPLKSVNFELKSLTQLKILKILNCPILKFEKHFFISLVNLNKLFLNHTFDAKVVNIKSLKTLENLKIVVSQSYKLCCIFWKFASGNIVCQPEYATFIDCLNLLSSLIVKILFWMFGCFGLILNVFSLLTTYNADSSIKLYKYSIIGNDLITAIYFLFIASVDMFYKNSYIENDQNWRQSFACMTIGTCLQFSLISSSLTFLLLTNERFQAVNSPLTKSKAKKERFKIMFLFIILSISISVVPNLIYKVRKYF